MSEPVIFDRTVRDPIDKLAAIVTAPALDIHQFPKRHNPQQNPFRQRIKDLSAAGFKTPPPRNAKDWSGRRVGSMTVLCYSHNRTRTGKKQWEVVHYWLCRCQCGTLEMRKASTLGRQKTGTDQCFNCLELFSLRSKAKRSERRAMRPAAQPERRMTDE